MKLVHSSDWHLGRPLYGPRQRAFERFLEWFAELVEREDADVVVVAGDIFDSGAPGVRAQELYYRFLHRAVARPGRRVVVVGGNHDSPAFLEAPRALLDGMRVHVVGAASRAARDDFADDILPDAFNAFNPLHAPDNAFEAEADAGAADGKKETAAADSDGADAAADADDAVLVLPDREGRPGMIVCAVPFLRERELRRARAGEDPLEKERQLVEAVREHYAAVVGRAVERRARLGGRIPIVATGHLFAAGGLVHGDDAERTLYLGSLARVPAAFFPPEIDYLALGHLHAPQAVGGHEHFRYSGSPLPMDFSESIRPKSVCVVEFDGARALPRLEAVPVFQRLERLRGDAGSVAAAIEKMAAGGSDAWLEIVLAGAEPMAAGGEARARLDRAAEGSRLRILRVRTEAPPFEGGLAPESAGESLDELDPSTVFERRLAAANIPDDERPALREAHAALLAGLERGLAE